MMEEPVQTAERVGQEDNLLSKKLVRLAIAAGAVLAIAINAKFIADSSLSALMKPEMPKTGYSAGIKGAENNGAYNR